LLASAANVKQFLTRLQLVPIEKQQQLLKAFVSKIEADDSAMASQLESTSVKVVSESTVFENPRNSAEKVTLVELEVDHSCTWEKALELAGSQEGLCGFFMPKKCRSQIFLALPIDALRLRLASPQRLYAGQLPTASLVAGFLKYGLDEASQAHAKKAWESRHAVATSKEQHL